MKFYLYSDCFIPDLLDIVILSLLYPFVVIDGIYWFCGYLTDTLHLLPPNLANKTVSIFNTDI
jgi:hypothetical protein